MPDHIRINPHLKRSPSDELIGKTFIGQAHIAGTGPEGKTCRECQWWYVMARVNPQARPWEDNRVVPSHPGYYGPSHNDKPLEAKKAKCNRPIANKSSRRIPHHALACRLFVQDDNPLPAMTDPPQPKDPRQKRKRKATKK